MQVYTIKKVSVETEAGFIYNFEDLPQENLYLKKHPKINSKSDARGELEFAEKGNACCSFQ